jgi:hypothetical protein
MRRKTCKYQLIVRLFKANRFKKGDVIDFEYELNSLRHYRGDNTIHGSNSVDGFYDREEFNTFPKEIWSKILCN